MLSNYSGVAMSLIPRRLLFDCDNLFDCFRAHTAASKQTDTPKTQAPIESLRQINIHQHKRRSPIGSRSFCDAENNRIAL